MRRSLAFLLALLLALLAPASAPAQSPEAARIAAHLRALAADSLAGRGTGTRGYDAAARYVAAQLAAAGLSPGANGGWLQRVPLRRAAVPARGARVERLRAEAAVS